MEYQPLLVIYGQILVLYLLNLSFLNKYFVDNFLDT